MPPSSTPRLITIPLSHYCERARWALDHAGVAYEEDRHLQRFHLRAVRSVSRGHTVPVLVTDEGVLIDSRDIVAWADARVPEPRKLYPDGLRDRIRALELPFEGELGVESRRLAYGWFLRTPKELLPLNGVGAPLHQRIGIRLGLPLLSRGLSRYFDITEETMQRAEERIGAIFDGVARTLADGRRYLAGDRFTAADLSFASLAAPVLAPREYGVPFPPVEEMSDGLRAHITRLRAHDAAEFALRLYRDERWRRDG